MIFWQMIRTYNGPTAKRPNWVKVAVVSWKSLYSRHDVYENVHLYSDSSLNRPSEVFLTLKRP